MYYSQLSQQLQSILATIPVYTPSTENPDVETEQQIITRQERFLRLPKGIRWKLASFDIGDKIELLGRKYGFELLRLANITRLIREYYFGEVRLEDFPREIEKRVGVSLLTAQEIARYIRSEIIDWDPWGEYIAKLPKLSVREILVKYPKIGNWEITSGYLEQKNSEELEDPTIKNWLHDFVLHLGQEHHSQMERTEYLFHSENGQNLSSPDREKLGIILKSFDENTPLPVDAENNEIVFDGIENKVGDRYIRPKTLRSAPTQTSPQLSPYQGERGMRPLHEEQKPASQTPNDFIKPFPAFIKTPADVNTLAGKPAVPQTRVQTPPIAKIPYQVTSSIPEPLPRTSPQPSPLHTGGQAYKGEGARSPSNPQIDKFFNIPETPNIPPLKIHSFTEHTEPPIRNDFTSSGRRITPSQSFQRPTPPQPAPRLQHKIINPFERTIPEPMIDGNVVDLSMNNDQ